MKYLVLLSILVGCSTVKLSRQAEDVLYLTSMSMEDRKAYRELGSVACDRGCNGRSLETNAISCRNELRNKAAQMGGTVVLVETQQLKSVSCANTATFFGTALRPKE